MAVCRQLSGNGAGLQSAHDVDDRAGGTRTAIDGSDVKTRGRGERDRDDLGNSYISRPPTLVNLAKEDAIARRWPTPRRRRRDGSILGGWRVTGDALGK